MTDKLFFSFFLQFRSMWTEFEWENRVNVNNSMSSVLNPLCSWHLHPHHRRRALSGILETICNMLWKLPICRVLLQKVRHQENVISFQQICMLEVFSVSPPFIIWRSLRGHYSQHLFFLKAKMRWPIWVLRKQRQGRSQVMFGFVVKRKALLFRWAIGLRWVCSSLLFFELTSSQIDLFLSSPAQRDDKPLSI